MIKEETAEMQATQKAFLMENKKQVPGGLTLDKGKLPMGQQEEGKWILILILNCL